MSYCSYQHGTSTVSELYRVSMNSVDRNLSKRGKMCSPQQRTLNRMFYPTMQCT